jgi:2-polyprenyl-3-methyl-5-hydroxy-6-metoxy-1,4-benzoquinol methylase
MSTTSPDAGLPALDEQRRFWDWHWDHWKERKVINEWTLRRADAIEAVLTALSLQSPRILDLGCGRGWFSQRLTRFGRVTGIDLSPGAIAAARAEYPGIEFVAGNVYEALMPAGQFDVVVSQEVIAHVEDQPAYVSRAAELLRPGGYLIITTGNKFVLDRLGEAGWTAHPPEHIAMQLDMRGVKRLVRHRFRVLRTRTIIPIGAAGVLRVVNSARLNRALGLVIPSRYLERLKEWAGLGYQMIVLARRER